MCEASPRLSIDVHNHTGKDATTCTVARNVKLPRISPAARKTCLVKELAARRHAIHPFSAHNCICELA